MSRTLSIGMSGPDVVDLQTRLNSRPPTALPLLVVDGRFGPRTDGRVREFQRNVGLVADGIVGVLTRARLGTPSPPSPGGDFIICDAYPFKNAAEASNETARGLAFAPVALAPASPRQEALAHKQDALNQVVAALNALNLVSALMRTGLTANFQKLATMEENIALNTHFKLSQHPNPIAFLTFLGRSYSTISMTISNADTLFVDDASGRKAFAFAPLGGFNNQSDPVNGRIFFCQPYLGKGPLFQTAVIVHEAAHFADRVIGHFASELPAPNGTPVDSAKNYVQLTADEASHNAYSYAQFALHMSKRADKRIVPFDE